MDEGSSESPPDPPSGAECAADSIAPPPPVPCDAEPEEEPPSGAECAADSIAPPPPVPCDAEPEEEPTAPGPPTALRAHGRTRQGFGLKWGAPRTAVACEPMVRSHGSASAAPPASDGGQAVTGYVLRWDEGNAGLELTDFRALCTTDAKLRVAKVGPGLPPGRAYRVTVAATNGAGTGESALTAAGTIAAPPKVPSAPSLSDVGSDFMVLAWPPSDGCGAAVSEYTLEMRRAADDAKSAFSPVHHGPDLGATVRKLTRATEYAFRVSAANRVGRSKPSAEAAFLTRAALPAAPPVPRQRESEPTALRLALRPPGELGGAALDAYVVEFSHGCSAAEPQTLGEPYVTVYCGGAEDPLITGLGEGLAYGCRVAVRTSAGVGPFSAVTRVQTAAVPPMAPSPPRVTVGDEGLRAMWEQPQRDGGSRVTAFALEVASLGGAGQAEAWQVAYRGAALQHTVTDVQPGRQYALRVAAENSAGRSLFSGAIVCTAAAGVPAVVGRAAQRTSGTRPPRSHGMRRTMRGPPSSGTRWSMPARARPLRR